MGNYKSIKAANNVIYGYFPILKNKGLTHAVSTRLGGVSTAPYDSLNLGFHTDDKEKKVLTNRQMFLNAIGLDINKTVTAKQIHQDKIYIVERGDNIRGATSYSNAIDDTDALITNLKGIPLALFFADCVPVIIYDPVKKAIGISHAGWKGTVLNIAQKTVLKMKDAFNSNPTDILAAIAPSIGPCCYEVDKKLYKEFRNSTYNQLSNEDFSKLFIPTEDKYHLNLQEANKADLVMAGVLPDNIYSSDICTSCNNDIYFSHRKDKGITGRFSVIACI